MIKIFINEELVTLPNDYITLSKLLEWRGIQTSGTAVALNNRHVRKEKWDITTFSPNDRLTIINGAFGG